MLVHAAPDLRLQRTVEALGFTIALGTVRRFEHLLHTEKLTYHSETFLALPVARFRTTASSWAVLEDSTLFKDDRDIVRCNMAERDDL